MIVEIKNKELIGDELPKFLNELTVPNCEETYFYLRFLYLKDFDFSMFNEEKLNSIIEKEIKQFLQIKSYRNANLLPTIFLSSFDFFDENFNHNLISIPRTINFIDSSIWFYYVPILRDSQDYNFEEELSRVIELIKENTNKGLYKLNVSIEYGDYISRALQESYLKDLEGHSKYIAPLIFHSETFMAKVAVSKKVEINEKISWNCLLVDDYGDMRLNATDDDVNLTKKKIIEGLLINGNISIDTVNTRDESENKKDAIIWKALKKLSQKTYDIVLLDYLLGNRPKTQTGREYSHELLILINNICNKENGYKKGNSEELNKYIPKKAKENIESVIEGIINNKGPLGKFWILNISSFHTAFLDRLREQGLGHNSEHWYLSRGGDPVNTPELFRFSLYSFMLLQQNQTFLDIKDIAEFLGKKIVKSKNLNAVVRNFFGEFILKFYSTEVLKKDKLNDSAFARSVLNNNEQLNNLLEHFRHLLYQIAFDSGSNMQIAWEELQLIKRKVEESNKTEQFKDIFNNIEDYIVYTIQLYN